MLFLYEEAKIAEDLWYDHNFVFYCEGGLAESTFYVDYRTEDGSANAGSDYEYSEGTLVFKPGETRKEIKVSEEHKLEKE